MKLFLNLKSRKQRTDFNYEFGMSYGSSREITAEDFGKFPELEEVAGKKQIAFGEISITMIIG